MKEVSSKEPGSYTTTKVLVLEFGVEKDSCPWLAAVKILIWGTY